MSIIFNETNSSTVWKVCIINWSSSFNHLWRNHFLSFSLLLVLFCIFMLEALLHRELLQVILSITYSRICRVYLPWEFGGGICCGYLQWEFATGICRGNLPQEFAMKICCGCWPWVLLYYRQSCFAYMSNLDYMEAKKKKRKVKQNKKTQTNCTYKTRHTIKGQGF